MRTGRDAEGRIKRWIGERMDRPRDPSGSFVQRPNDDVWTRSPDTGSPMAALWQSTPTSRRRGKPRSLFSRRNTCSRSTCRHTSILRSSAGSRALRLCLNERSSPMFISDIAGSAETTDSLESEELTGLLNCYFVGSARIQRMGAKVCVSTRLPEGRPLAITRLFRAGASHDHRTPDTGSLRNQLRLPGKSVRFDHCRGPSSFGSVKVKARPEPTYGR